MLERVSVYLTSGKVRAGTLMAIMKKSGTIKWSADEKDYEIMEFCAQVSEGVAMLSYNTDAWYQLQIDGRI